MKILVAGAGGALGGHLVKRLHAEGNEVVAVDIKPFGQWWQTSPCENIVADLSMWDTCREVVYGVDRVYNLAADMGGMGFIETHRADCMMSVLINTHLVKAAAREGVDRYWYASSACVYAADKQSSPESGYRLLREEDAYPAMPEAGYGEEKLFSEQMCLYVGEDRGMDVRIARMHNVYGPQSSWTGGREKAPAALCRKVAEAKLEGEWRAVPPIEIWGDGSITRSFLYVDDFVEGAIRIMESDYRWPLNLGSDEIVTVDELVGIVEDVAGVHPTHRYNTRAPQGVAGRGSDNSRIRSVLGWAPTTSLREGISVLYPWVEGQVRKAAAA